MCEIKEDRIHIGINEYNSNCVYFFPVSSCKYQHELRTSNNGNFICVDREAAMVFLERKYFTAHASDKFALQYITYYPKREILNILELLDKLVTALERNIDHPSLGEELYEDMIAYCEWKFDFFMYKVVSTIFGDSCGLNHMKAIRLIILDFYQRFGYNIRELFSKEPHKQYLCFAAAL